MMNMYDFGHCQEISFTDEIINEDYCINQFIEISYVQFNINGWFSSSQS